MDFPILYKRDSKGNIQTWQISTEGNTYSVTEGLEGGKLTSTKPHACEGKNPGKKNETTGKQQAEKEAKAEWTKKKKKGYVENKTEVDNTTYVKPMKGDKWVDREDEVVFPVQYQDKLNGVRYQAVASRSYSTGGETFHTTPHIRAALAPIFKKYPDAFIDGEAYNYKYRKTLNRLVKLVSVVIKEKDLTPELLKLSEDIVQFHVFDGYGFNGISKTDPWIVRHTGVKALLKEFKPDYIHLVDYKIAKDFSVLKKELAKNKEAGGEGLMIRWGDCLFKEGRSKYLLKLKHFEDAEFEIVEIQEGNGDWKGCAKRIILKLHKPATNETKDTTFAANIEGDMEWLKELYIRREEFIGQMATVEFQQYSEFGIPQIPWVRCIRNYEKT